MHPDSGLFSSKQYLHRNFRKLQAIDACAQLHSITECHSVLGSAGRLRNSTQGPDCSMQTRAGALWLWNAHLLHTRTVHKYVRADLLRMRMKVLHPHLHRILTEHLLLLLLKCLRHEVLLQESVLVLQVFVQLRLHLHSSSCTLTQCGTVFQKFSWAELPGCMSGHYRNVIDSCAHIRCPLTTHSRYDTAAIHTRI